MRILSLKDHLVIWTGFLHFTKFKYDMQMLGTVPPAIQVSEDHALPHGAASVCLVALLGQTAQKDLCFIPCI